MNLATQLLTRSGLAALCRRLYAGRRRWVLEFHGTPPSSEDWRVLPSALRPGFTRDDLRAVLGWLGDRFRFLTPDEFLAARRPGVLLTFDDGFAHQAEHAVPILAEHRAPAVFFVTTQHVRQPSDWLPFVRRALEATNLAPDADLSPDADPVARRLFDGMSTEQLRLCADNPWITIGCHTVSHPFLSRCDDDDLARELADSKRYLEEQIGRPVELLAYPTGDYDERVARAARDAGYRAAFVEDRRGELPGELGAFEIPRVGIYRSDSAYLATKLSGLHRRGLPVEGGP